MMRSEEEVREALGLIALVAMSAHGNDEEAEEAALKTAEVLAWIVCDAGGKEFGAMLADLKEKTEQFLRAQRQ